MYISAIKGLPPKKAHNRTMAVSYTHLDVYKRQAMIRAEDMKKGVFSTIGQLPKEEPRKGSIACLLYTSLYACCGAVVYQAGKPAADRRVHARYMLGMKVKDIAAMEGITPVSYTHLRFL